MRSTDVFRLQKFVSFYLSKLLRFLEMFYRNITLKIFDDFMNWRMLVIHFDVKLYGNFKQKTDGTKGANIELSRIRL